MKILFVVVVCLIGAPAFSQGWRTISILDTTYFQVDTALTTGIPVIGSLRVVWVDSTNIKGSDSVSYFYKTISVANQYKKTGYIDTNGSSWLGELNIRTPYGDEYYINFLGDSILFKTNAKLYENWLVTHDTSGIEFWGQVISLDTTMIDGVLDSIKTIQIEAKLGGVPIAHPLTHHPFTLSKNHGFIQVQPLVSFPYFFDWSDVNKQIFFTGMGIYSRVPTYVTNMPLDDIDLAWKYKPGNAFQYIVTNGTPAGKYKDTTVITDFITNYIPYNADSGYAFITRNTLFSRWVYGNLDAIITTSTQLIDTVVNHANVNNTIRKTVWPEAKIYSMDDYLPMNPSSITYNIGARIGHYCDDKKWTLSSSKGSNPEIKKDTAGYFFYINNFFSYTVHTYFEDFYIYTNSGGAGPYASSGTNEYIAYNVGDCKAGKQLNFPQTTSEDNLFSIYPNPVTDKFHILQYLDEYEYFIYNTIGQLKLYGIGHYNDVIDIGHFAKGVYFIKVDNKVLKLLKL